MNSSPRTWIPEHINLTWAPLCTQHSKAAQSTTLSSVACPAHALSSCEYYWENWKSLFDTEEQYNIDVGGVLAAPGTLCTKGNVHRPWGTKLSSDVRHIWVVCGRGALHWLCLWHCCMVTGSTPLIPHVTRFSILPHHRVCPDLDQPVSHPLIPLFTLDVSYITAAKSLQLLLTIIFVRPAQAAFPLVWKARTILADWRDHRAGWRRKKVQWKLSDFQVSLCTRQLHSSAVHSASAISINICEDDVPCPLGILWWLHWHLWEFRAPHIWNLSSIFKKGDGWHNPLFLSVFPKWFMQWLRRFWVVRIYSLFLGNKGSFLLQVMSSTAVTICINADPCLSFSANCKSYRIPKIMMDTCMCEI